MLILTAIISVIIIIVIMSAAVITTSKAYSHKHTIDPIENNPNIKTEGKEPSDN